jgi:hypothetical protein
VLRINRLDPGPYMKSPDQYEPRIKQVKDRAWIENHNGETEVDIANTLYAELPSEWQRENKRNFSKKKPGYFY